MQKRSRREQINAPSHRCLSGTEYKVERLRKDLDEEVKICRGRKGDLEGVRARKGLKRVMCRVEGKNDVRGEDKGMKQRRKEVETQMSVEG